MRAVVLVGPMGAGKSSVGRRLATRLGFDFADTDVEIERRTGVDIAYIFEREGEAGFRKRESKVLEALIEAENTVVATGGGVVMLPENRERLAHHEPVVYLHATVAQQYRRVRYGKHRPLLEAENPRQVLQQLFDIREPWYRQVSSMVVDTEGARVDAVARQIAERLGSAEHAD